MNQIILAKRYIEAFKSSIQKDDVVSHLETMKNIIEGLTTNEKVLAFLTSPISQMKEKENFINQLLTESHVGNELKNFFLILIKKDRTSLLHDLKVCIKNEITELNNEIVAEITTPEPLNKENELILLTYLKDISNKKVKPEFYNSNESIGGFKAKMGNNILDGTLENSLNLLKQKFISLN